MMTANDTKTGDMLPDHDLAGERPAKPTEAEKTAKRLAKMREKKDLAAFTVNIDRALKLDFDAYLERTGKSRNEVIEHVLRTQVLRKR
jgi:hypothetical protein